MLGLYLHIPFCEKKCIYCDFYSVETTDHIADFVQTLQQEIALRACFLSQHQKHYNTVFFGGGTPSLLSAHQLDAIISCLHKHFSFADNAEWTMECNPGTVTRALLNAYRALGINRLSYGVQSFFDEDLVFLSRIHSGVQALDALNMSREAGFENLNIDLMFSLPYQPFDRWQKNVEYAISLGVEHISAYSLIFEHGTPLYSLYKRGQVRPQDEKHEAALYRWTIHTLTAHGYEHYEVSNFAQQGKICRHNCVYWHGQEYVSFGPSAHGYIYTEKGFIRYWNIRGLKRYTDSVRACVLPIANYEVLSLYDRMVERVFLELRSQGIRKQAFYQDFHIDISDALSSVLPEWTHVGLVIDTPEIVRLSPEGYAVCDSITVKVLQLVESALNTTMQSRVA
ncbi:MAG: radical SAM family heme chaperone HemW [Bacteroidota bacterium]|nr:radical SAM family heme chaperone HemW [Candidatus Kapabacteria bacterium]MDW8220868.1 radical SAM family heme chaperone HemW [Bacteroidota bacterium]